MCLLEETFCLRGLGPFILLAISQGLLCLCLQPVEGS
jgi:hypothetical protein